MLTALADAQGVMCLGIGGGGDCVGAYAIAEIARGLGTPAHAGGITWERRPIDPLPGARRLDEVRDADPLNDLVALAHAGTTGPQGARFCESHLAEATGERVVLADPNPGPAALGAALADAVRGASSLQHANTLLGARGIRTELDYETELAAAP